MFESLRPDQINEKAQALGGLGLFRFWAPIKTESKSKQKAAGDLVDVEVQPDYLNVVTLLVPDPVRTDVSGFSSWSPSGSFCLDVGGCEQAESQTLLRSAQIGV
ncbi:hypothetical protein ACP4J5_16310 [Pseudomonas oryzihabitans]|uniref:hypothetical protein n=1 Tax=Pseudomonas oryzihabitans TaxID=47885 RepID=UPI003CEF550A